MKTRIIKLEGFNKEKKGEIILSYPQNSKEDILNEASNLMKKGYMIQIYVHRWSENSNSEYSYWLTPRELSGRENSEYSKFILNLDKEIYFLNKETAN